MAKARELERELRSLTIEKARADAMLEVCTEMIFDPRREKTNNLGSDQA